MTDIILEESTAAVTDGDGDKARMAVPFFLFFFLPRTIRVELQQQAAKHRHLFCCCQLERLVRGPTSNRHLFQVAYGEEIYRIYVIFGKGIEWTSG